jgi:hypothetical protein
MTFPIISTTAPTEHLLALARWHAAMSEGCNMERDRERHREVVAAVKAEIGRRRSNAEGCCG